MRNTLEIIEKVIEEIKEKNKEMPILVEGEKDVDALHSLGINGKIITVYQGKNIPNLCDHIAKHYKEIIILTDWDRSGWKLCRQIEKNLEGRTKCITEYRIIFAKNCMVKNMEGVPSFIETLRKAKNK